MVCVVSWNVNGLRSNILTAPNEKYKGRVQKGKMSPFIVHQDSNFTKLLELTVPDIVCLQETRCDQSIFDAITNMDDYPYRYLHSSTNPARGRGSGYSGTAIFSKIKPNNIIRGLPGVDDIEGRCIIAEFDNMFVINVYTPNSGTNEDFRINTWDPAVNAYLNKLKTTGKTILFTGDLNVCHQEIDIFSGLPPASQRIAGLLPEERDGIQRYIDNGFVDAYRELYPKNAESFTWWNPRVKLFREANKGWRIDYTLLYGAHTKNAGCLPQIYGSDHCPIFVEF